MANTNVSIDLPVSQQQAWETLSDMSKFDSWLTIHDKWRSDLPTELTVGAQVSEQVSVMGMTNVINWTIEKLDAPSSLTISGTGLAGAKITFVLSVEPVGADSSKATIDATFTGTMIVGAIGKAVEKSTTRELITSLDKLKGVLA